MANVSMVGEYTVEEINAMTPTQQREAAARSFTKPVSADPADAAAEASPTQGDVPAGPQPSGDVWARRKAGKDVFICPSGQTCRLKEITPDELLVAGILDKVTRLEGLAAELVNTAEGQPPSKKMPTREDFAELLSVINALVPLAVAEPRVYPDPAPGEAANPELLYTSEIALEDRMAIMEEALKAIRALDRFRLPR